MTDRGTTTVLDAARAEQHRAERDDHHDDRGGYDAPRRFRAGVGCCAGGRPCGKAHPWAQGVTR